nr:hypothetical protein [Salinicola salarius]
MLMMAGPGPVDEMAVALERGFLIIGKVDAGMAAVDENGIEPLGSENIGVGHLEAFQMGTLKRFDGVVARSHGRFLSLDLSSSGSESGQQAR